MSQVTKIRFGIAAAAALIISLLAVVVVGEEASEDEAVETTEHQSITGNLYEASVFAMPGPEEELAEDEEAADDEEMDTIDEATVRMLSYEDGLFIEVDTEELDHNSAYTLWLMTVSEPEACEERPCSMEDVMERSDEVQADVGYLDGTIADEDGSATLGGYQEAGELRQSWFDQGLDNPEHAEVHLIVRDHGPMVQGMAETMVNTFRGGCSDASLDEELPETALEDGEAGPNECQDVQMSFIVQEPMPVATSVKQ